MLCSITYFYAGFMCFITLYALFAGQAWVGLQCILADVVCFCYYRLTRYDIRYDSEMPSLLLPSILKWELGIGKIGGKRTRKGKMNRKRNIKRNITRTNSIKRKYTESSQHLKGTRGGRRKQNRRTRTNRVF